MKSRSIWVGALLIGAIATAVGGWMSGACAGEMPQPAGSGGAGPLAAAAAPAVLAVDPPTGAVDPGTESNAGQAAKTAAGPRVVLLGFDGGSYDLAKRFMAEGRMPWATKLAASGGFLPLGSANPAESPVAWASINTGMNPGKTNIFGFMRRTFRYFERKSDDGTRITGMVWPIIGYSREEDVPFRDGVSMPVHKNDLACENFWDHLDRAGKRSTILQAACNYPAAGGQHTELLAGLSVPDVRGGPGTYLVYTNSEWEFPRNCDNGGKLYKFKAICPTCKNKGFTFTKGCTKCNPGKKPEELGPAQRIGYFETKLEGPENFVEMQRWKTKIAALEQAYRAAPQGTPQATQAQKELNAANNQMKQWRSEQGNASVPLTGTIDRAARTITFQLAGREFVVKEGEWSPYVPITFEVKDAFPVKATAHLHVSRCNEKDEDVRFYLPAITAAPDDSPPNMPITSPREFGKELVGDVGYFDTIGWSCQTHALKDEEIPDPSFLSAIWDTIEWRRKMLVSQLEENDWQTLFQVFGETDRVCHMMYRYFDEKHPQYKAEEADQTAKFGGREIKLRDAIPAVYEEIDRTIGLVMERIEKGQLGDCTLMVCSDHGFSPFREEVELNAWLIENGFMTLKSDPAGKPVGDRSSLSYVDWSKTKAYSVSIGTIYINLRGREPEGSVDPKDYDAVCDDLIAKMRAYRNPNPASTNDPQVIVDAWKRSTYLAGPFAGDLRGEMKLDTGTVLQDRCLEGPADIQVGFNYGYRVAWGTALGDRAKGSPVFPNKSKWSGDHTSVHPYLVRGIFFCNRKVADGAAPHLQDLAPTILTLHGVAVPADMDGHVIPLAGLEEAAKKHQGGTANRESLVPPQ